MKFSQEEEALFETLGQKHILIHMPRGLVLNKETQDPLDLKGKGIKTQTEFFFIFYSSSFYSSFKFCIKILILGDFLSFASFIS
jgi:hypothetical protein